MTTILTVGVDQHRQVFTATVLDERDKDIGHRHFENTHAGGEAVLTWARTMWTVDRVGVEGASGLGRSLAEYLVDVGVDVRDVPPHKTSLRARGRHEGKSDRLDSHRVASETQTNDRLAHAFKQSQALPPDRVRDRIGLWHNARVSLRKIRVQLIGDLDAMIHQLPEDLRSQLPTSNTVRARINALANLKTSTVTDPVVQLRLRLLEHRVTMLRDVLAQDKKAETELAELVIPAGSTLPTAPGIAARAAAEILLETGNVRRFTEAGFARFNGTAPGLIRLTHNGSHWGMDGNDDYRGSIVVGADGSAQSDEALRWAAEQAVLEKRVLTVLHAPEMGGSMAAAAALSEAASGLSSSVQQAHDEAQTFVLQATAAIRELVPALDVQGCVGTSPGARAALLYASQQAALIVIGSRGRGPVQSRLLGSLGAVLAHQAHCPVVVLRPWPGGPAAEPRSGVVLANHPHLCGRATADRAFRHARLRRLSVTVFRSRDNITAPIDNIIAAAGHNPQVRWSTTDINGSLSHALAAQSHQAHVVMISSPRHLRRPSLLDHAVNIVERAQGPVYIVPETPAANSA